MYDIIYADPPWRQSKGGKKAVRPKSSGEVLEYPTLSIEDIGTWLEYWDTYGNESGCMFLWTIDKYLWEAEKIGKDLEYKLHARMIWNKVTGIPATFTIRFDHEYLLWFYWGKLLPIDRTQRGKWHSVLTEQVKRHSQKPEIAYQFIESIYPNAKKIELFARNHRDGWDSWGNEIENKISEK